MDFTKLKYDVTIVPPKTDCISYYPELADYEEFANENDDMIFRVCVLAHDENSPFVKLEKDDYEKRLTKVFEFLKIRNSKLLNEMCIGKNSVFENMVNRYFMVCDNLSYVMWANKLRMFHYIGIALRQPMDTANMLVDMDKRAKLDIQLQAIYSGLLDYEAQVFTDIHTRRKLRSKVVKLIQPAEFYADEKSVV